MSDIDRIPGESDLAYHKRLVYGKSDGTLQDYDYTELAPLLYGKPYSSDMTRRMIYGSRLTLSLMDKEAESAASKDGILHELERKKNELQMERVRFFDQRREYNKLVAQDGRWKHLEERLVDAAASLNETVGMQFDSLQREPRSGDSEAVLVLCDWHYGMTTNNVWNTYNTEICKERLRVVIQKAVQKIELHQCGVVHVLVLGDLIHGAIHTGVRVSSEELVCDQIMQSAELLAQAVYELRKHTENVMVYTTYGNHARTVQKKEDNLHRDNLERIIPWWLSERLKNVDGIHVVEESDHELIYTLICGHGFCASHGDLDGMKTSTRLLPVLFQKKYGIDIEYVLLGDKHHRESFEEIGVNALVCDALCGTDEYANTHRLYATPGQTMLIVTPEGVDAEYHLRVN